MSSKHPAGFAHPFQNYPEHTSLLSRGKGGRAAGWALSLPGSPACSHHLGMAQLPLCAFPCEHISIYSRQRQTARWASTHCFRVLRLILREGPVSGPGVCSVSTEGTVDQDKTRVHMAYRAPSAQWRVTRPFRGGSSVLPALLVICHWSHPYYPRGA